MKTKGHFKAEKLIQFIKKEIVLCVAAVLAVLSAFLVPPDDAYAGYIDFRTLGILFCLMSVMAGLQKIGVFEWIAGQLLAKTRKPSGLVVILVFLCFFFSMAITNDVALITFVPFVFTVGRLLGEKLYRRMVFPTVVLQTIAANLGSMLTPIGNPQNLYLYGISDMDGLQFVQTMLPYSAVSFGLLAICCAVLGRRLDQVEAAETTEAIGALETAESGNGTNMAQIQSGRSLTVYLVLFVFSLFTVARIVPLWITMLAVLAGMLIVDAKVMLRVDYSLLLTFVGFFVFIGNMGRLPAFSGFLQRMVVGHEVPVAVLASQCISNVPAALLLSGFTENVKGLLIGTNLGGLGTLIASMASLISYKYVAAEAQERDLPGGKGRYFLYFTIANIGFLVVLGILYLCIA
ncbi:MAG: anion permease [Lachnospiraceae bacterium]|nr:anion permease [Lachnospiraceae bacterium]